MIVIDDLSTGRMENLADAFGSGRVEHYKVDIAGPELERTLVETRPEVVHHLAAQIDVRHSVADPLAELATKPVVVFGDGCQTRDYVCVDDVVEAFVAAGKRPGAAGHRFNIGSGVETSVLRLYEALREVTGFGPEPTFAPARPGELRRVALDPSVAERVLGWRATTPLSDGLAMAWSWVFSQANAGSVGG